MFLRFGRGTPDTLENLHPAYFALVMATGIIAIACHLHAVPLLPTLLFWLNALFLGGLLVLLGLRLWRYRAAVAADIRNHGRGIGFLTIVAAFGVFGSQLILQIQAVRPAMLFWAITAGLWLLIFYGLFAVLTVLGRKPGLARGLNGAWLISVVATQSLAILTLLCAPALAALWRPMALFAALVLWLAAGALYIWLITLIFYRYIFLPMSPADLTPSYWINMGAVAISTLAGTLLVGNAGNLPLLTELLPFVKGMTLFFWAIGTLWIPMLLLLGLWRHVLHRQPFSYDPQYWGMVFPLGMYSVCTFSLATALDLAFLLPVAKLFLLLAVAAWALTLAGLIESRLPRVGQA